MDESVIKICGVCGDKAFAKNFGALTCQPCKAFFRSNAKNENLFICYFGGKCVLNVVTRKLCKKCRLVKCFAIGMKKELILTESEKRSLREIVEKNRQKKKNKCIDKKCADLSIAAINYSTESSYNINSYTQSCGTENLFNCSSDENSSQTNGLSDSSENESKFCPEFKCTDIAIHRPINDYKNKFYDIEVNKLSELVNAMNPIRVNPSVTEIGNIEDSKLLPQLIIVNRVKCLTFITQCLSTFRELCIDDQEALVKSGCIEILNMRAIHLFNYENHCWNIKLDNFNTKISLDVTKQNLYTIYKDIFPGLAQELNSDAVIIDLLTAILLFSPNRPNIIHRNVINLQQKLYIYLLQRYLQLKYSCVSEFEVNSKFSRLMNIISNIYILGKILKKEAEKRSDEYNLPIIREIFELK